MQFNLLLFGSIKTLQPFHRVKLTEYEFDLRNVQTTKILLCSDGKIIYILFEDRITFNISERED